MSMKQLFRLAALASLALLASSARAEMTLIADWNDFRSLTRNGYTLVLGDETTVDADGDGITIGTGGAYIDLGSAFHNCTVELDCMVTSESTTQVGTLVSYMMGGTAGTAIALVQLSSTSLDRTWGTDERGTTYTSETNILSFTTPVTFTQVYAYEGTAQGTTTYLNGTEAIEAESGLRANTGVYRINLGRSDANDANLYTGLRILRVRLYGSSNKSTYPTADEVASSYNTIVSDRSTTPTTYTLSEDLDDTVVESAITASTVPGVLVSGARKITTTADGGMTLDDRFFLPASTDTSADSLTFSDNFSPYTESVAFTTSIPITFQNNVEDPAITLVGSGDVTIRKGDSGYGVVLSDGGYTGTVTLYNGQPLTRGSSSTFALPLNFGRDEGSTDASIINNSGSALQFTGVLSGSGALDFQGAGVTSITNTANTFSGEVTVTSGSVYVGNIGSNNTGTSSTLPASSITVKSGAGFYTHLGGGSATSPKEFSTPLVLESGSTFGNRDGHVNYSGAISLSGDVDYTFYWEKTNTVSGKVSGSGTLTVIGPTYSGATGAGTLSLTNTENDYTGTYILQGQNSTRKACLVTTGTAAQTASVTLQNAYTTLTLGDSASVNTVTNNGGTVTLGSGATVTTLADNTGTITLSGDVTMSAITTGTGTITSSSSSTITVTEGDLSGMTLADTIVIDKIGTGTLALGTHRPTLAGVEGVITLTADGNYTFPTTLADGTTIAASCFSLTDAASGASVTGVTIADSVLTLTVTGTPVGELSTTISTDTTLETLISASTTTWTDASSVSWSGDLLAGYTDTLTINSDTAVTLTVEVDENGATIVDLVHLALGSNVTLALVSATEGTAVTLADDQTTSAALVDITSDITLDSAQLTADSVTLTGEGTLVFTATSTSALTTAATGLSGLTDSAGWTGTVQLSGVTFAESDTSAKAGYLSLLGNTKSTIELKGTNSGYFMKAGSCSANFKLTGTMTINNGYGTSGGYTFAGALSGTGALSVTNPSTNPYDVIAFTGDVEGFTGSVTVASKRCVAFGSKSDNDSYYQLGCIYISSSDVTINAALMHATTSASTSTTPAVYVAGTATLNGAVTGSVTVLSDGTLTLGSAGTISGTLTTSGTTTIGGALTDTNTLTVSAGSVEVSSGGSVACAVSIPSGAALTVSGGSVSGAVSIEDGGIATISSGTVSGTLDIASTGSVTLSSTTALTGTVTGSGNLIATSIPTSVSGLTDSTNWTGTFTISSAVTSFNLNTYGNDNSTVEFNGASGYVTPTDGTTFKPNVKITGNGWTSNNGNSDATVTFTGDLTGTGTLTNSGSKPGNGHVYKFTGIVSDFAGAVVVANKQAVVFGDETSAGTGKITIATTVNVASGKTWSAGSGISVTSAGIVGGAGTLSGAVTLADGATISVTDTTSPLTVSGTVTCGTTLNVVLPSGFSFTAGEAVTILSTTSEVTAPTTAVVTVDGATVSHVVVQYVEGTGLTATLPKVPEDISGLDTSSSTSTVTAEDVAAVTEVLQEAAAKAGVTSITSITGTTKTSATSPTEVTDTAQLVGAIQCFKNVTTVDSTGVATVAYNFGITKLALNTDGTATVTVAVLDKDGAAAAFTSGTTVTLTAGDTTVDMTVDAANGTATGKIESSALTSGTTTIKVTASNTATSTTAE